MSRKLLKSTFIVGAMTMLSRLAGMARDIVVGWKFGATGATDAFFIAFKIPNFFRRLTAEASFTVAFVPVLTDYKTNRTPAEVKELIDKIAGGLASALFLLTLVGVVLAPILIIIFANQYYFDPKKRDLYDLASTMLMITFPYVFFISLTAFAGAILNAFNKFAVAAFTPVLLNVCMIACAIYLAPYTAKPIYALAIGVFIAGVAQMLFQIPFLMKMGLMPRPRWDLKHEGVRKTMRLMVPAVISASVMQISLLLDQIIATSLQKGAVSWLYFSDRLVEFPVGIFGIALGTVILPSLSRCYSENSNEKFSGTMDWALRLSLFIALPAGVGLIVLAGPLITMMYYRGAFTEFAVEMTTWALVGYAIGLIGFIFMKILAPGFYARHDTKTPMRAAIIALSCKLILSLLFIYILHLVGFIGTHVGLAAATGLAAFINCYLLYRKLRKDGIYTPGMAWIPDIIRIFLSAGVMAALILWMSPELKVWIHEMTLVQRIYNVLMYVGIGIVVYLGMNLLTGLRPWRWKSGL